METIQGIWKRMALLQLALIFVSLSVFSMGLNSLAAAQELHNQQITAIIPKDGKDATVDYNKIGDIIDKKVEEKISQIPQPKNGSNGTSGINGTDGVDGKSGADGSNGQDGRDGLTIQPRNIVLLTDQVTGDLQWKYEGDTFPQLLLEKCKILDTCGVN